MVMRVTVALKIIIIMTTMMMIVMVTKTMRMVTI